MRYIIFAFVCMGLLFADWGKEQKIYYAIEMNEQLVGYAAIEISKDVQGNPLCTSSVYARMTLIGGFLLMIVYDRLSGDGLGNAAVGIFVWMLAAAGLSVVNAGDVGGMLITSGWTGDNMVMIFGSMIIGGVGATAALMFGDMILGEEE